METLASAIERLARDGYRDQFISEGDRLRARDAGATYAPESLAVDEIARFEGCSDPADSSAVFALRSPEDGTRGTYTVAYGPDMAAADATIVSRLKSPRNTP